MRRKVIASLLGALVLAGCGLNDDNTGLDEGIHEVPVELKDGRTVTCILYKGYRKGGLSCDWGAK